MQKTVTKTFRGKNYMFDVTTAPANQAVHVAVQVNRGSLDDYERIEIEARYLLREIAEETAKEVNKKAYLIVAPINTGTEYQAQFNFDSM